MSALCATLEVARSNIAEQVAGRPPKRRGRPLVRASRTASSRNSLVKRVWGMKILLRHQRLSILPRQVHGDLVRRTGTATLLERAGQVLQWREAGGVAILNRSSE